MQRVKRVISLSLLVAWTGVRAQSEGTLAPAETLPSRQRIAIPARIGPAPLQLSAENPLSEPDETVKNILSLQGLHPSLGLRGEATQGLFLSGGDAVRRYAFTHDGTPLCEAEIKTMKLSSGGMMVLGSMPLVGEEAPEPLWPTAAEAWAQLGDGSASERRWLSNTRCYWVYNQVLIPAWTFEWVAGGTSFRGTADASRLYQRYALSFHAAGRSRIYPNNKLDPILKDYTLTGLKGSGYLESSDFTAVVNTKLYSRAYAADNNFVFDTATSEFAQSAAFTNASRHLSWFRSIGFTQFGDQAIQIEVHGLLDGSINNAVYQPASGNYPPTITIGDGDGKVLQNLATDGDVVSHELGHHIVYRSITVPLGESLVLHEGLADYFTFARTGNACLGESICPKGSPLGCNNAQRCLRSGENQLSLDDPDLPLAEHLRSQFISGMLWDLRVKSGEAGSDFDKVVLKAVDLLVKNSGYQDLVLALASADQSLNQGKFCAGIIESASARGLAEAAGLIECGGNEAATQAFSEQATTATVSKASSGASTGEDKGGTASTSGQSTQSNEGGRRTLCGAVTAQSQAQPYALWSLILGPLLLAGLTRRRTTD